MARDAAQQPAAVRVAAIEFAGIVVRPPMNSGDTAMSNLPGLQFPLGEEIEMLRDSIAGFAAKEIAPRAAEKIGRAHV